MLPVLRLRLPISAISSSIRQASLREQVPQRDPRSLYEPIIADKRIYPEHDQLNVRLQGPDYAPLEVFQAYVHKISLRFGFEVSDSYGVAAKTEKVITYKRGSTVPDSDIELAHYDRWIRLKNVPAARLPIFMHLLKTHLPIGVQITVQENTKEDENYRYIPDLSLQDIQEELKSLDNPMVRRALGWE